MSAEGPTRVATPDPPGASTAWVDRLAEAMADAWSRGERRTAAEILAPLPDAGDEAAIRLIFEEICLRRESGLGGATAEVLDRYPRLRAELEAVLSCDRLLCPPPAVDYPEVGDPLGDFRLLAELGRGTSGRTFLAAQPSLADRPVVLKVTPREHDEHLSLARLQHTHIVPLYSAQAFPDRGLRALCMPYLGGANLAQILAALADIPADRRRGRDLLRALDDCQSGLLRMPAEGPFRRFLEGASYARAICWIAACLADALHYAHVRGLVHMDVKPTNVLIAADGQPMLLDFHLARGPVRPGESRPEYLGGTPGWMSPEQRSAMLAVTEGRDPDAAVDGRSDLYSLGLLIHGALFGPDAEARPGPGRGIPRAGAGLAGIVRKCLEADPGDRYADAAALAEDLRRCLDDLPLRGIPDRNPLDRWRRWRRREPHALARMAARLTVVVALLAIGLSGWSTYHQRVREIRAALGDARRLGADRQFGEAIRAARRGLTLAARTPATAGLTLDLERQRGLCLRGFKAGELHELADLIRFRYGIAPAAADEARSLAERCGRIWQERGPLRPAGDHGLDPETTRQIGDDLRELAIIWSDLRVRLAPKEEAGEARRDALRVLDEAGDAFGRSWALDRERCALAEALRLPIAGTAPDPGPRTAWDHYDLGRSYFRSGRVAEAAEEFRRTLELRPQDFWPNFYQGLCAYRLGRPEESVAAFRACITLAPGRAECYFNRALACDALGRAEDAARDYTRALELNPALAAAALNRGILAFKAGRPAEAIADYRRALRCPGGGLTGPIHYNLALAHAALADRRSAASSAREAIRHGHEGAESLLRRIEGRP